MGDIALLVIADPTGATSLITVSQAIINNLGLIVEIYLGNKIIGSILISILIAAFSLEAN